MMVNEIVVIRIVAIGNIPEDYRSCISISVEFSLSSDSSHTIAQIVS